MELNVRTEGNTLLVKIIGTVDADGGKKLTDELLKIVQDEEILHGQFDLTDTPAISSAGIGKLLRFYKHFDRIGGTMRIKGISSALKAQFSEIHLDQIISIED